MAQLKLYKILHFSLIYNNKCFNLIKKYSLYKLNIYRNSCHIPHRTNLFTLSRF